MVIQLSPVTCANTQLRYLEKWERKIMSLQLHKHSFWISVIESSYGSNGGKLVNAFSVYWTSSRKRLLQQRISDALATNGIIFGTHIFTFLTCDAMTPLCFPSLITSSTTHWLHHPSLSLPVRCDWRAIKFCSVVMLHQYYRYHSVSPHFMIPHRERMPHWLPIQGQTTFIHICLYHHHTFTLQSCRVSTEVGVMVGINTGPSSFSSCALRYHGG